MMNSSLAHFVATTESMLTDLEELVGCESPSGDDDASARSAAAVDALGTRLLGVPAERVVVGGTTHLRWRFGSGRGGVLLLGHHDTVWPIGTLDTFPWSVAGGIVRGPGCFDMKAGLVQIFHALAALEQLEGVCVVVSGDEEVGSPTAAALIEAEARACDAVLVAEPSADGGALKTGRAGVTHYELVVEGRSAHAGLDRDQGVNAAVELAHQVLAVRDIDQRSPGANLTPTVLSAGTTPNTVPGAARLAVDVRVATIGAQEDAHSALQALRPRAAGASLRLHRRMSVPPLEPRSSAALFDQARQVAAELGLDDLVGTTVGGGSDGNKTAALGVPTLDGLGAVGGGAHSSDEHVVADRLAERAALLCGLVELLRDNGPVSPRALPGGPRIQTPGGRMYGPHQHRASGLRHDTGMADLASRSAAPPTLPRPGSASPSVDRAVADADAAAAAADVVVREVGDPPTLARICAMFRRIWREDPSDPSLTPLLLHALSYAGNYVAVAAVGDELVGACVGFHGLGDHGWELHSHIAGVTAPARGRNVGFALKTHQRAWALHRGLDRISWTFDPLVRRNAYFNLSKLGVRARAYLNDFYGPMSDGINAGDETDRLVAEWRLLDEPVARACAGRPEEPDVDALRAAGAAIGLSADASGRPALGSVDAATVLVGIPVDVENLRAVDATVATEWRRSVRQVLGGLLADGAAITGFSRAGCYVVQRAER